VHCTTSCNTQSSAPEDGWDHRPKHVELIGIINISSLLHLVGVYISYCKNHSEYINSLRVKNAVFSARLAVQMLNHKALNLVC